jgi:hypothetical protein
MILFHFITEKGIKVLIIIQYRSEHHQDLRLYNKHDGPVLPQKIKFTLGKIITFHKFFRSMDSPYI